MPTVPSTYWKDVHGRMPGEALQDEEGLQIMRQLGRNMAFMIKSIALGKEKYGLEAFLKAFDNFDYLKIMHYDETKVEELKQNKDIIRNSLKINASIINAKVFIEIQKEFKSFDSYIWSFTQGKTIYEEHRDNSPLSDRISKDLKKRGMKFVGTTIIYAFLEAIGILNTHEASCFLHKQ